MISHSGIVARVKGVLEEVGLTHPPFDPFFIASSYGIPIEEKPLGGGTDGFSGRPKGVKFIIEARHSMERKRFTVAHELGHHFLHTLKNKACSCKVGAFPSLDAVSYEAEADAFAVELLMPEDHFKGACLALPLEFASVTKLAEDFGVSVTACALRFVSFRYERCVLVCCVKGYFKWHKPSPLFPKDFLTLVKGAPIHKSTYAYDYSMGILKDPKPATTIMTTSWFPDCKNMDSKIVEECFPAPEFGFVLSLLSFQADDVVGSEDEEDY